MAKTHVVDPQGIIRTVDTETNKNLGTYGAENLDKSDYLKVTGNGATLATGVRTVDLKAINDDDTVAPSVCFRIQTKGASGLFFPPALATKPTWAAWMEGALVYDTANHKFYMADASAWTALT